MTMTMTISMTPHREQHAPCGEIRPPSGAVQGGPRGHLQASCCNQDDETEHKCPEQSQLHAGTVGDQVGVSLQGSNMR